MSPTFENLLMLYARELGGSEGLVAGCEDVVAHRLLA